MHNPVLAALRRGDPVTSLWLVTGSVAAAELMANAAPDAIVFDDQHGLWERSTLYAGVSAVRDRATPLVRTPDCSSTAIGNALDSGALGVILPMIETSAQAAAGVQAAKYPPLGMRSGGGIRPLLNFPRYASKANDEILVAVMIETAAGAENAAAIAKVAGVDLVFIGGGDLSLSLGTFPEFGPRHEAAVQDILAACKAERVPCGIYCPSPSEGPLRVEQGFRFLFMGSDNDALHKGAVAALQPMRHKD